MIILLFLLACYGATNIMVASKLTKPLRIWAGEKSQWAGYLINCFMCVGFWMGIGLFICGLRLNIDVRPDWLIMALSGSAFCWIVRVILNKLDEDNL